MNKGKYVESNLFDQIKSKQSIRDLTNKQSNETTEYSDGAV